MGDMADPPDPTHKRGQRRASPTTDADLARRRRRALQLLGQGQTYEQVAAELGYDSRASVATDLRRDREQARAELALTREDWLQRHLADIAERRRVAWEVEGAIHYVTNNGLIVMGVDGQPMVDDAPRLRALDRLRALAEEEARLLGLDAPTQVTATVVNYTIDGVPPEALT